MTHQTGVGAADYRAVLGHDFWSRVKVYDPGCWVWTGSINRGGYGSWNQGRKRFGTQFPHRCVWLVLNGPVPDGYEIDHVCFNPACVKPSHLRLLTKRENRQQRRIELMHRTHCPQGHPIVEGNISSGRRADGRRFRQCLTCQRERQREWRQRNPDARSPEYWREYRRRKREAS